MEDDRRYVPDTKIIPKEHLQIIGELKDYEAYIRKKAENMDKEVEKAKQEAYQEGYETGLDLGRKDMFEALTSIVDDTRVHLTSLEDELVEIVMAALEQIIGKIGEKRSARMAVKKALKDLSDQAGLTLHVSAEEQDEYRDELTEANAKRKDNDAISLNIDSLLRPGEIVLETPQGRIHIGVGHQIATLKANLENDT